MKWQAEVRVWLKPSVFDPQGYAVESALAGLGHEGVEGVRIGKYMQLTVDAPTEREALAKVDVMCTTVLCNPVMETYAATVRPLNQESAS